MLLYCLSTDQRNPDLSLPCYSMGQRWGSSGCCTPVALFPFATHDAAIRHTLDPTRHPHPMPSVDHSPLTAAVVLDLRASVKSRIPDFAASNANAPCVRFNAELDGYELHNSGNVLCWSRDLTIVAALLRGERYEPGFIRRVLDPAYLATELALDADEREARRRHRASIDAQARARAREAEEAAREARRRSPDLADVPEDLTLDDLLAPNPLGPQSR